jgi:hypothetical protein
MKSSLSGILFAAALALFAAGGAQAQDVKPVPAIAMHGDPKYPPDF